jgi:hypothetical protein
MGDLFILWREVEGNRITDFAARVGLIGDPNFLQNMADE